MAPEAPVAVGESPTIEQPVTEETQTNKAAPTKVQKKANRKAKQAAKVQSNGKSHATVHKAKAKPTKTSTKRPAKDDARKVSKHSDGSLNVDQVRILRVLRDHGRGELNRNQIKEAVGIGIDKKYSGTWLKSLWNLMEQKPPLMFISEYQPDKNQRSHHMHSITADGRKVLERAEKAASKAE
jgi:hypothetical protein